MQLEENLLKANAYAKNEETFPTILFLAYFTA
jgi:hypothetical protein